MRQYIPTILILLLTAGTLPNTHAWDTSVNFHGTLVAPPSCDINGGAPIDVDFGNNVVTTQVDGTQYRQPLRWTLVCSNNPSNSMRLQLTGTGATFDGTVLATNLTGLGIRLSEGSANSPLNLNSWLNFTYPTLPVLTAVPVKDPSVTLSPGAFTAGATLVTEFR